VDWGGLRQMEPVSRQFGYDRGTPVDRYYIERFLRLNSSAVFGRFLRSETTITPAGSAATG